MKRFLSLFCCICLIFSLSPIAFAASDELVLYRSEREMEDGITVIYEIIIHPSARSNTTDYTHRKTFTRSSSTIAVISIWGKFRYDGSTVSVVSKEVTQTDTYEGWSYSQSSFTSSGGTITLSAKLTKTLTPSIPFTMTPSCDKNGNISYT